MTLVPAVVATAVATLTEGARADMPVGSVLVGVMQQIDALLQKLLMRQIVVLGEIAHTDVVRQPLDWLPKLALKRIPNRPLRCAPAANHPINQSLGPGRGPARVVIGKDRFRLRWL